MRILLVGSPAGRAALRARLDGSDLDVVGEFPTTAAARASGLASDAVMVAPGEAPAAERNARHDEEILSEPLTPREIEVLALLAEGLPNKAIAERLRISAQTVKFHVGSILGKLGAANRTEAVRRAVRRGLIAL